MNNLALAWMKLLPRVFLQKQGNVNEVGPPENKLKRKQVLPVHRYCTVV